MSEDRRVAKARDKGARTNEEVGVGVDVKLGVGEAVEGVLLVIGRTVEVLKDVSVTADAAAAATDAVDSDSRVSFSFFSSSSSSSSSPTRWVLA